MLRVCLRVLYCFSLMSSILSRDDVVTFNSRVGLKTRDYIRTVSSAIKFPDVTNLNWLYAVKLITRCNRINDPLIRERNRSIQ